MFPKRILNNLQLVIPIHTRTHMYENKDFSSSLTSPPFVSPITGLYIVHLNHISSPFSRK